MYLQTRLLQDNRLLIRICLFRRWLISHGLRLASWKTLESQEVIVAFGEVVNRAVAHGKAKAMEELCEGKILDMPVAQVPGYNASAHGELLAAMQKLKLLELPHLAQLERKQDHPIGELMEGLTLVRHVGEGSEEQLDYYLKPDKSQLQVPIFACPCDMFDPFLLEKEVPLQEALQAHRVRLAKKRKESLRAIFCGAGAAHLHSGLSVSLPAVLPTNDELLQSLGEMEDAAHRLLSFDLRRCDSM